MNIYFILLQVSLPNKGRFYAEYNPDSFLVEPWNALSSFTFWIPIAYWLIRLKGQYKEYPFLMYCMPWLFVGGLGSALFHGLPFSRYLLLMDVLPIVILNVSLVLYFWAKIFKHWLYSVGIFVLFLLLQYIVALTFPRPASINVGYFIRGVMIFLPCLIILQEMRYRYQVQLYAAIFFFILALVCRYLDKESTAWLYMGSHWLWHIFCAVGAFYLSLFMYHYTNFEKISRNSNTKHYSKKKSVTV